uniref:Cyanocobalamin reductase (cyanide-eliminating) n=1 Tax=Caligus clemensi TaxID=344056 RepID=C1C1G5_CALCM|nr:Methylmalonic aciduria and homocystinuria type C homolog [Caligus clemensi]
MVDDIQGILEEHLGPRQGFETHPFRIRDYNAKVSSKFSLPFEGDSLGFALISTPSMFEKTFPPYLISSSTNIEEASSPMDPLDECMRTTVNKVIHHHLIGADDIRHPILFLHDFEIHPNRRPKILVQTAGHVSGSVRLYQAPSYNPVCLHPLYGGWFALRGALFFPNIQYDDSPKEPPNILQSKEEIHNLLELFNDHWRDARYRDVIPVKEKYSPLQRLYFETLPVDRIKLLRKFKVL